MSSVGDGSGDVVAKRRGSRQVAYEDLGGIGLGDGGAGEGSASSSQESGLGLGLLSFDGDQTEGFDFVEFNGGFGGFGGTGNVSGEGTGGGVGGESEGMGMEGADPYGGFFQSGY